MIAVEILDTQKLTVRGGIIEKINEAYMYMRDEVDLLVTVQIITARSGTGEKPVRFNLLDLRVMRRNKTLATLDMLYKAPEIDLATAPDETVLVDFTPSLGINAVLRVGNISFRLRHRNFKWPTEKTHYEPAASYLR